MKTCFTWLHLTDFHQGMAEQSWLWQGVKQRFFEDLAKLHGTCGAWDLVLFTGDLTQRGSVEEFKKFNHVLEQLWEQFDKLGFSPELLAVPGNHDLVRPNDEDPSVKRLLRWHDDQTVRNNFWNNKNSPCREVVSTAFQNYMDWLKNHPFKAKKLKITNFNYGILPGDFSVTIEKDEAKLGILGLNSTFLQLSGGDYEGKLDIHARQFHNACGDDGPDWAKQHHACLLMSHHPPAWLKSQEHLTGHIVDHGRFAAHLCGHLHESAYLCTSEAGAETKCIWQSHSLFSTESFEKNGKDIQRLHGYTLGKIELKNEKKGSLMFWPRVEVNRKGRENDIIPDYPSISLTDEHTTPRDFNLLKQREPKRTIPGDDTYSSLPYIAPVQIDLFTPRYSAHFEYVVGNANELKTLRKENVYDHEGRERWKAYYPPINKEIGVIVQEIAAQEKVLEKNLISRLKKAKQLNKSVIIIVDPWSLKLSKYSKMMLEYDESDFFNCDILFVLNSEEIETQAKLSELRTELKQIFFTKNRSDFLQKREALSEKVFRSKLLSALERTKEEIIKYGKIRKIKGSHISIPTINNTYED